MKYSHVWHPGAGCQISFIGYTLKLCAYNETIYDTMYYKKSCVVAAGG